MKILGIIPSRYASTRFPGKPLVEINGITMIRRVFAQAEKCRSLSKIIIATDDERIFEHAKSFTDNVVYTSPDHVSGTDRCAEALMMQKEDWDAVVNIQGDEPFIDPEQISLVCKLLEKNASIATLIKKITNSEDLGNSNIPKVVIDKAGKALYFSRQAIPFVKGRVVTEWTAQHIFYKHIGIYGYNASVLQKLSMLPEGSLEKAEGLEQLRWLENGLEIHTSLTELETIAIDTPDDLRRLGDKL